MLVNHWSPSARGVSASRPVMSPPRPIHVLQEVLQDDLEPSRPLRLGVLAVRGVEVAEAAGEAHGGCYGTAADELGLSGRGGGAHRLGLGVPFLPGLAGGLQLLPAAGHDAVGRGVRSGQLVARLLPVSGLSRVYAVVSPASCRS
jgi:hypothetical protein